MSGGGVDKGGLNRYQRREYGVEAAINGAMIARQQRSFVDVHVEGSLVLVFYQGRFAGVGVDVYPSRPDEHSFSSHFQGYRKFWKGKPLLLDWSEWFVDVCSQRGMELRS